MKTKIKLLIIVFVVILPQFVSAASIFFGRNIDEIDIGQQISLSLYLNTEGEVINTIGTEILYPNSLLEVKEIKDNTSVINFWIENEDDGRGRVVLSGLTPGGYFGQGGEVVTVVFVAKNNGLARITTNNTAIYLNDGLGTAAEVRERYFDLNITDKVFVEADYVKSDFNPPESFVPEISRSPAVFDNNWFIVFSTKDKLSGISHYFIRESKFRNLIGFKKWQEAESPYLLKDQSRRSYISIKAVDRAGNSRIETVKPDNPNLIGEAVIWVALIIFIIFILYFIKVIFARLGKLLRKHWESNSLS